MRKWLAERRDRSRSVLLELETHFNSDEICKGRASIEDDKAYGKIREAIISPRYLASRYR